MAQKINNKSNTKLKTKTRGTKTRGGGKRIKLAIKEIRKYMDIMEIHAELSSKYEGELLDHLEGLHKELVTAQQARLLGAPLWQQYKRNDGTNEHPMILSRDWSYIEPLLPEERIAFMKSYVMEAEPLLLEKWKAECRRGKISKNQLESIKKNALNQDMEKEKCEKDENKTNESGSK